mgnify:CR=1 FL=1
MIQAADRIYVMEKMHKDWILRVAPDAKDKVTLLGELLPSRPDQAVEINIPDPIRMSGQFYKNVLVIIRDCLKKAAESL